MKKIILFTALLGTSLLSAQNFTTFGLSSNPDNIVQNPGADPMTRFQLRYVGLQANVNSSHTAAELFGTNDLLGNIIGAGKNSVGAQGDVGIVLPHLGFKLGKNYFFAGLSLQTDFGAEFDTDLLRFVKYGMGDENGNFDGNYSGDFSSTSVRLALSASNYFGYQRTFMDEKLRVGFTYTSNTYAGGFDLSTSRFDLNSTASNTVGNTLTFGYDLDVASTNLFTGAQLDSLSDLNQGNLSILNRLETERQSAIATGITLNTFGFGITYRPLEFLEASFSMSGLGANSTTFLAESSKVWSGSATVDGFEYTSSVGDSISVKIGDALENYTNELTEGFSPELSEGNYEQTFTVAQHVNATVNLYLNKRSYVGMHYATRSNSYSDYNYLGFNSLLFLGRNLQLKGGYYLSMDETNSNLVNLAIQTRITPLLQVYVGSNSVSDMSTIANSLLSSNTLSIGSETRGVNLSAGLSMTFFDNRFKTEKDARKLEREAEKADTAKSLQAAPQTPPATGDSGK